MSHHIRLATLKDVPEIHRLVNSAYRGDSSREGWTTEADLLGGQRIDPDRLEEMIKNPDTAILCLEALDRRSLLGVVALDRIDDSMAYLGMLTIDPGRQASGFGRELLAAAEAFAGQTWGATWIKLTVIQLREELIAWYERRGYRKTGETEPFPYGDVRFGEPRRSDLQFIVFKKALS